MLWSSRSDYSVHNCNMFKKLFNFPSTTKEQGQGLVEYALILVLVAIVVIAILLILGPTVGNVFSRVVCTLQPNVCGPGVITNISTAAAGPNRTVTVSVSQSTSITISASSGTIATPTKPCNSSCTFLISGPAGSGSVTATASEGGTMTANW